VEGTTASRPIAIVTGAGKRGAIGAAICRALAAGGHDLLFTHWRAADEEMGWGSDPDGPAALAEELRALGARAEELSVDQSRPEAAGAIVAACVDLLGTPRVLINNAAYSTHSPWETLDAATLDAHYAVNVRGMALLSVAFATAWPGGEGGRIVNLTSGQSQGPMPGELAYVASKGAVEAFTLSFSAAVAARGITVNAVNPGPTDSGWMTDEVKEALRPKFGLGRIGLPADVARLVAFLASKEAGWMTGQVIHSEGGFLRS